jgi:hypothetical protein
MGRLRASVLVSRVVTARQERRVEISRSKDKAAIAYWDRHLHICRGNISSLATIRMRNNIAYCRNGTDQHMCEQRA